jgi:outer membrane protein assembly factor BamB
MDSRSKAKVATVIAMFALAAGTNAPLAASDNWPSFRGNGADGAGTGSPPATWDVETGENVLFRIAVPGLGHSSPVIWEDRLFLTTAVPEGGEASLKVGLYGDGTPVDGEPAQRFQILAFDKRSGKLLWQHTAFHGTPAIKRHMKASHTNSTPATDGKVLVAFFGSEGLHAYDLDGNPLWNRQFGVLDSGPYDFPTYEWGFASSPIVHDGRVVIQADILSQSFVAVLDAATGEDVWRKPREEVATWSTPAVFPRQGGGSQVVLNGYRHIGGYDFDTGEELWRLEGGGDIPVPTPVRAGDGPILITNAHGRLKPIYAIDPEAEGTLDPDHDAMVWFHERLGNYMQTPLVVGDLAYFCYDNGVVTVVDWRTGERLAQKRLGRGASGFSASAVAAGGRIYFNSEVGDVYVIEAGPELNEVAVNELGETLMATPAISEGVIYFRARRHLIAVGSGS